MNKKDIKTEKSREKILDCATVMFGERGYDNFSISALCKTYDISKGLLYHNFSGKDEIFLCCVKLCYEKMLNFLKKGADIPAVEEYIELRLQFFKENPLLSRIFFESFVQEKSVLFNEIKKLRSSLVEFNSLVYSNFIETVELRSGITKKDAMSYFELIQKMINVYYSNPTFKADEVLVLEKEYKYHLSKFLECIVWGVADKDNISDR